jgi:hypothetical protein
MLSLSLVLLLGFLLVVSAVICLFKSFGVQLVAAKCAWGDP